MPMNWDVIEGKWNQLKADARIQWGKLTDDEWDQMAGQRDKLAATLQERYGWERAEAESRIDDFMSKHSKPSH
jgi:uncharacterized protein YjbJ (UPF0337 family)